MNRGPLFGLIVPVALLLMAMPSRADDWTTGAFTYNKAGDITAIGTDIFTYDTVGRLLSGTAGAGRKQEYSFDDFGNILTIITDGSLATRHDLAANPANNRLDRSGSGFNVFAGYDDRGNMTSYLGSYETFTYDGLGVTTTSTSPMGVETFHIYGADDERVGSIIVNGTSAGTARWTMRDLSGKVLRSIYEYADDTLVWEKDYIYRGSQLLSAAVPTRHKVLQYHLDHLGTPRLVTTNGGAELARLTYYPFGKDVPDQPATDTGKLKFTGHERDSNTLDYMHARYYNSVTGRFLSVDPDQWWTKHDGTDEEKRALQINLRRSQGWNRYSYVYNNPLRYTDPDGRVVLVDDALIGLAILGTIAVTATHTYLQSPNVSNPSRTNAEVMGSQIQSTLTDLMSPIIQARNNRHTSKVANGLIAAALTELGKVGSAGGPEKDPDFDHHKAEIKAMLDRAVEMAKRLPGKAQEEIMRRIREIGAGVGLTY